MAACALAACASPGSGPQAPGLGTSPDPATAPVGSYAPNAFGPYDVLGNLAEWTEDCWNANCADARDDGGAWSPSGCERRVLRGGTWAYTTEMLRVDYRLPFEPGRRDNGPGFRVARVILPPG